MADFSTLDDIVAGLANTETYGGRPWYKKNSVTSVANYYYSSWTVPGLPIPASTAPTTQAVCTDLTTGALGTFTNAPAGGTNRLLNWSQIMGNSCVDILYDRLKHMGGLSLNSSATQTVNLDLTGLTGRCAANGSDVEWFLEVFSAGGATTPGTITITYTNQSGTTGRTATITGAASFWPAYRVHPITTLQAGDTSIQSIQSVQFAASGTVGNLLVVAAKRLGPALYIYQIGGASLDHVGSAQPKIPDDACLWMVSFTTSSSTGIKDGQFVIGAHA